MWKLLRKIPLWFVFLAVGFGYAAWANNSMDGLRAELARSGLSLDSVVQIDSITTARLAQTTLAKDSLAGILAIADSLDAEVVAAAVIHADPAPTATVTIRIPVLVTNDSTRIGQLSDTTEDGVIDVTVVAPPCCEPLDLTYAFDPAPLDLSVALLRIEGDNAVFAVQYRGGTTDIEAPFARLPAKQDRFIPYVGAYYEFGQAKWAVKGGVNMRIFFGLLGFVEGSQRIGEGSPVLTAGFTKEF